MSLPDLRWKVVSQLLTEAREHITSKPWDDKSCLHARISLALGLPVEYEEHMRQTGQWEEIHTGINPKRMERMLKYLEKKDAKDNTQ